MPVSLEKESPLELGEPLQFYKPDNTSLLKLKSELRFGKARNARDDQAILDRFLSYLE